MTSSPYSCSTSPQFLCAYHTPHCSVSQSARRGWAVIWDVQACQRTRRRRRRPASSRRRYRAAPTNSSHTHQACSCSAKLDQAQTRAGADRSSVRSPLGLSEVLVAAQREGGAVWDMRDVWRGRWSDTVRLACGAVWSDMVKLSLKQWAGAC